MPLNRSPNMSPPECTKSTPGREPSAPSGVSTETVTGSPRWPAISRSAREIRRSRSVSSIGADA
ncbi:hypothetical protein ACFQX8_07880 [Klenkia terrae]|uniref:hypothetical protein n=1 Tax=Klenkia terrae TaxID=1052259 RepID=UPI00361E4442